MDGVVKFPFGWLDLIEAHDLIDRVLRSRTTLGGFRSGKSARCTGP